MKLSKCTVYGLLSGAVDWSSHGAPIRVNKYVCYFVTQLKRIYHCVVIIIHSFIFFVYLHKCNIHDVALLHICIILYHIMLQRCVVTCYIHVYVTIMTLRCYMYQML